MRHKDIVSSHCLQGSGSPKLAHIGIRRHIQTHISGSYLQSILFSRSGVGPKNCISNTFLSNADVACQNPHFKNHYSPDWK